VVSAGTYWYLDRNEPAKPKQEKSPLDPKNFTDFKLKKVLPYNHNTSTYSKFLFLQFFFLLKVFFSFVFELPNNDASLIPVASCLLVKASNEALLDGKGKPIVRPYTPISPSDHRGELAFLIKRYDQGNMSKHISSLKVLILPHISDIFHLTYSNT
jgi:cytochrome-b5 reductase